MKHCPRCKQDKPDSDFNKGCKPGQLQSYCKACAAAYAKAKAQTKEGKALAKARSKRYFATDKGKAFIRARDKRYKATPHGRAGCRRRNRKWQKENPELMKSYARVYRENNLDKEHARCKRYRKERPDVICAIAARRRARKLSQCPADADQQQIAQIYARAAELRALGYIVEVDHRMPLALGGLHEPDNLRIISDADNRAKSYRLDYPPCYEFPLAGPVNPLIVPSCNA